MGGLSLKRMAWATVALGAVVGSFVAAGALSRRLFEQDPGPRTSVPQKHTWVSVVRYAA